MSNELEYLSHRVMGGRLSRRDFLGRQAAAVAIIAVRMDVRLPAGAPSGPTFFDYSVTAVFL